MADNADPKKCIKLEISENYTINFILIKNINSNYLAINFQPPYYNHTLIDLNERYSTLILLSCDGKIERKYSFYPLKQSLYVYS